MRDEERYLRTKAGSSELETAGSIWVSSVLGIVQLLI